MLPDNPPARPSQCFEQTQAVRKNRFPKLEQKLDLPISARRCETEYARTF
jgi:hypothetical protein